MGTRENRLGEAVLTSTHNLCFRAKIRKHEYPCKPQFYYIKVGWKGVFITQTCYHDDVWQADEIMSGRSVILTVSTSRVNGITHVIQPKSTLQRAEIPTNNTQFHNFIPFHILHKPIHRRAVKEGGIFINRDLLKN